MNEEQKPETIAVDAPPPTSAQPVRPTKKQQELLVYISAFIAEHGYSPSYREIMNGCKYTSVATVALHVNSLIKRGHLRKRDHSARSLEVVDDTPATSGALAEAADDNWLLQQIVKRLRKLEKAPAVEPADVNDIKTLLAAAAILELYIEPLRDRVAALQNASAAT